MSSSSLKNITACITGIVCIIFFPSCQKQFSINDGEQSPNKPNIVFILADDIGYEIPAYTGGQSYSTPAIDNLAQSGMQFSYCNVCPNCTPTRIELLTGKYGFRNYTRWGTLDPQQKTIANMLQSAGYKTCVAGKWQLDGGDASLRGFGFDKYLVFEPFYTDNETLENKYRYKSPRLYTNGQFLPDDETKNKYADDLFVNFISDFIDSSKSSPFFIYYPLSLCHMPFSPTPDDAGFATWDPFVNTYDTAYFPSMVHYMDKKVQQVVDKIKSAGLINNTIIIFMGDNGTPINIHSTYNNNVIPGGKATSTIFGTHVPMIVSWQGTIAPQQISNALVDGTDFLPAIADMAKIKTPTSFGQLDGKSFYPLLFGSKQRIRDWIYCYWNTLQPKYYNKVWVQDETYKQYDTTNQNFFFNISIDDFELNPLPDNQLSPTEASRKKLFDSVLSVMH